MDATLIHASISTKTVSAEKNRGVYRMRLESNPNGKGSTVMTALALPRRR